MSFEIEKQEISSNSTFVQEWEELQNDWQMRNFESPYLVLQREGLIIRWLDTKIIAKISIPAEYPNVAFYYKFCNLPLCTDDCVKFEKKLRTTLKERALHAQPSIKTLIEMVEAIGVNDQKPESPIKLHYDSQILEKCKEWIHEPHRYVCNLGDILKKFEQKVYIFHIENIINYAQCVKFETVKKTLHSSDPNIMTTFHGTNKTNTFGIASEGLLMPEQNKLGVVHGAKYGLGVYSSPDPHFAIQYISDYRTPFANRENVKNGYRLVVCSVQMGKMKYGGAVDEENYDSYMSSNDLECVVYNSDQIMPVYIIYFDVQINKSQIYYDCSPAGTIYKMHGHKLVSFEDNQRAMQRLREAKLAARRKNAEFYIGKRFKILEICDDQDDDDDETAYFEPESLQVFKKQNYETDYGEYQGCRFDKLAKDDDADE